jgi:hypothetical protein
VAEGVFCFDLKWNFAQPEKYGPISDDCNAMPLGLKHNSGRHLNCTDGGRRLQPPIG